MENNNLKEKIQKELEYLNRKKATKMEDLQKELEYVNTYKLDSTDIDNTFGASTTMESRIQNCRMYKNELLHIKDKIEFCNYLLSE